MLGLNLSLSRLKSCCKTPGLDKMSRKYGSNNSAKPKYAGLKLKNRLVKALAALQPSKNNSFQEKKQCICSTAWQKISWENNSRNPSDIQPKLYQQNRSIKTEIYYSKYQFAKMLLSNLCSGYVLFAKFFPFSFVEVFYFSGMF